MLKKSIYKIGRNFSMIITAQIAYKAMLFVTFILIARDLGVAGFGKFSYAMAYAGLLAQLADFGTSSSLVKETSGSDRHKIEDHLANTLSLKIILSFLTIVLAFISGYLFKEDMQMIKIILLSLVFFIISAYTATFRAAFRVFEKMEYDAISVFLEGLLKLVLIVFLSRFLKGDPVFIINLLIAANIITLLVTAAILRKKFTNIRFSFKISSWPGLLNGGMVFVFAGFFQMANLKIDTIMLSKMTTDTVTGIYSVAVRVIEPTLVMPLTFAAVAFPVLSQFYKESRSKLRHLNTASLKLIFLIGIFITALIYFGAGKVIPKILGDPYIESIYATQLLCLLFIPISIRLFLEGVALAVGMRKRIYLGYLTGTIIKIAMNLLLIPLMGYKGAAIGTIAAEFVIIGFLWSRNYE